MNSELTRRNPYPGPCPFQPHEGHLFFGREQEVGDLLALVIAHRAVLLYAQSGAGKTSILNAKLIPALLQEGFEVFPVARVHRVEPEESDWKGIDNIYVLNTLLSWEEAKVNVQVLASLSLIDALQKRKHQWDRDGNPLPRALIFDQFEELFTSYAKCWEDREAFFRQVNEALEQDRLLRVLFVIREDYLAELDPYAGLLPEELQTRYRLERLRPEAACLAIAEPAERAGRPFDKGVASELVQQLLKVRVKDASGETVEAPGEYVEPVQLQVVCRSLWDSLPPEVTKITSGHLKDFANVQEALKRFYEGALRKAMEKTGVSENDLRAWFDGKLVTPAGTRGTVFQGKKDTGGIPNAAVAELESQHILRAEPRAGARWYELTHDQLIEPIHQSNEAWFEHQRAEERQRQMETTRRHAEEQRRQIEAACRHAEEQWRRAEEQTKLAQRFARLTAALVVMVVVALVAAGFAFYEMGVARKKTADAEDANRNEATQRGIAEQETRKAEGALRISTSHRLIAEAVNHLNVDPELSLLLALEATSRSQRDDGTLMPELEGMLKGTLRKSLEASRVRLVLCNHAGTVNGIAFSPDGRHIATASADGTAKLWDAASGNDLVTFYGHTNVVNAVAFSPDGKRLATGSDDGTARMWDTESGRELLRFSGHLDEVKAVAFSPDGQRVATASSDGTARVWDAGKGGLLLVLAGHMDKVADIAFDPRGMYLATAGSDRQVKVWNASSGYEAFTLYGHKAEVTSIAFSPNGTRVASGDFNGAVKVWDLVSGKKVADFAVFSGAVLDVAFSPDGRQVAAAGFDGAKVCDASSGQEVVRIHSSARAVGMARVIAGVAFHPDGRRLATAGWDRMARVWATAAEEAVVTLRARRGGLNDLAFSPDGRRVAAAGRDGAVQLWDARTGDALPTVARHRQAVKGIAYSPDGKLLATASEDGTAKLWDTASGEGLHTFSGHGGGVKDVAFSPDGTRVATASADRTAKLWDIASGAEIRTFRGHEDDVLAVAFSPDGKQLATASRDRTAKVWDVASGANRLTLRGHTVGLLDVTFHPDGTCLATASKDKTVKIWDAVSGEERRTLSGHDSTVLAVAFSPDRLCVASAGMDGTARLWDVASGRELCCFSEHTGEVGGLAFSQDGEYLATAGMDGVVHIRVLGTAGLVKLARTWVTRSLSADELGKFQLLEDSSHKARACLAEGRELARAGYFTEAVRTFRTARELDPNLDLDPNRETIDRLPPNGLATLARQLLADVKRQDPNTGTERNVDLAYGLLIEANRRDPKHQIDPNVEIRRLSASILVDAARERVRKSEVAAADLQGALLAFGEARKLDPTLAELDPNAAARRLASQACVAEGWRLFLDDDTKKAIEFLEKAAAIDAKHDLPCRLLGIIYRDRLQQGEKAIPWLDKAVAIAPTPESNAELALAHTLNKEYDRATDLAEKALKANPEYSFGSLVLGSIKQQTGQYDEAIRVLRNIKESNPHYATALMLSGTIYCDAYFEFEAAYEKFRRLLELEPNSVAHQTNFAEANLTTGRFPEAYEAARRIVLDPEAVKATGVDGELAMRFVMIASLVLQGSPDEARRELTEFVRRYNSLAGTYGSEWSYKGTRHFLETRAMPEGQRKPLLDLLGVLEKPASRITVEQILPP